MTSDFTKNKVAYIDTRDFTKLAADVTLNQTTVPYHFGGPAQTPSFDKFTLTINEGVTIYISNGTKRFMASSGRLMINGTASKKVKITRLPSETNYFWGSIHFGDLPGSVIKHCIFEYGGSWDVEGMLYMTDKTQVTLENVEINNAKTYGAAFSQFPTNIIINHSNVTFKNNGLGNVSMYDDVQKKWVVLASFK